MAHTSVNPSTLFDVDVTKLIAENVRLFQALTIALVQLQGEHLESSSAYKTLVVSLAEPDVRTH